MKLGFRTKTMFGVWLIVAVLMLGMLAAMVAHSVDILMVSERADLKRIAKQMLVELDNAPTLTDKTFTFLDQHMEFLGEPKEFGYAVIDNSSGAMIHCSKWFQGDWQSRFKEQRNSKLYLTKITSGKTIGDKWTHWHFLYRRRGRNYTIFLYDIDRYELYERLIEGLTLSLIVTVLVAMPAAFLFSKRVLDPVDRIVSAARQIRGGDFNARIDAISTNDELSRLIDDLNTTFKTLQEAISARSRFSSDVAHELRTPLACLIGAMEVCLNRERTADEYREVLTSNLDDARELARIVEQLLLLTKPANRIAWTTNSLPEIVKHALESLTTLPTAADHQIDTEFQDDAVIRGDAVLLQRMCANLIENALKFSPPKSTIFIGVDCKDGMCELSVRDQGIGIAEQDQARIFDRFYQVDSSRAVGSGLGLPLAKWVADLHDGSISVESVPGHGATFTVRLPIDHP